MRALPALPSIVLCAAALLAAGCSHRSPEQRRAAEKRPVTIVGCIEQDRGGELVLVGRAVDEEVSTATGTQGSGVPSTTTLRGGDGDRISSANGTREDWAARLAPRLEGGDRSRLQAAIGHRVIVQGQFVPATRDEAADRLEVASLSPVSNTCTPQ